MPEGNQDQSIFGGQQAAPQDPNAQAAPQESNQQPSQEQPGSQQVAQPQGGTQDTNPASQVPDYSDRLSQITDENGRVKYRSVEDALDALPNANSHIKTLEQENAEYRERQNNLERELARYKGAAEAVDRLAPTQNSQQSQPAAQKSDEGEIDISQAVRSEISAYEAQKQAKQNVDSVTTLLRTTFGEDAENKFYGKADELGLTKEQMNQLAASSPRAVLAYFPETQGHNQQEPAPRFEQSSVRQPPADPNTPPSAPAKPEKSVLFGSTQEELTGHWNQHKEYVEKSMGGNS